MILAISKARLKDRNSVLLLLHQTWADCPVNHRNDVNQNPVKSIPGRPKRLRGVKSNMVAAAVELAGGVSAVAKLWRRGPPVRLYLD
jgi:hypothetical protein